MKTTRAHYVAFTLAMLTMTLLTPLIRTASWLATVPDPIEAYLRPVRPLTSFTFFPWAGFVFAGAIVGLMLDGARTRLEESRANLLFGLAGVALVVTAWGASYLPSPYPRSDFWTSSPAFFFLRTGLLTAAVALAYVWQLRPAGQEKWSPLKQLGRSSLFIYWIHVEMVYGLISLPLHKALTLPRAWLAFAAFSAFMLICAVLKERVVGWWRTRQRRVLVHDQVKR
ncbi:MAG: acyltransferase [Acidobacteria bacterium]|nr:acyltransferase [Acidobacteriota bacterium]